MRLFRVLVVATSFAALLAQPSAAQEGRPFHDAWFWGAKGGILAYSATRGTDNSPAPMAGVEWLITRSRGALYASVDQSFFTTTAYFGTEPYTSAAPYVTVTNLRRISLVGMVFPMQTPTTHPYAGLGASLHQAGAVRLETVYTIPALQSAALDSIQAKKVTIAPMAVIGVQQRLPMFSVFAQGTGAWLQNGFFLHHPNPKRGIELSIEAGIRYNVGTSIDRDR